MNNLSIQKIISLSIPVFINYLFIRIIDGQPLGWARGGPILNRIVSGSFVITLVVSIAYYCYVGRENFKEIKFRGIAIFIILWLISLLLHITYMSYNLYLLLFALFVVYLLVGYFQIKILKKIKD